MPKFPVANFREAPNPEILNAVRNAAGPTYRERIPEATQANLRETAETLHKFPALRNEFDQNLVNRIGLEIFNSQSWNNPLAEFKQGMLPFGSTVEEIQQGLVKATVHDWDRDSLEKDVFGQARVDTATSFHTINRENKYKVTTNEAALRRAFTQEYGLGQYIHNTIGALETSNNFDEFMLTARLLTTNHDNDGFYLVHSPAVADKATAEDLLINIRAYIDTLPILSTRYNAAGMPVAAQPDELVVITTPFVKARMDVQAFAAAFNVPYAEVPSRIKTIPAEFWPIDGAQAILTTTKFFQIWDTYRNTTSLENPDGRYTNYWLHADGIFSMSRFVPAILFTSNPVTEQVNVPLTISSVSTPTLFNAAFEPITEVVRGEYAQVISSAVSSRPGVGEGVILTLDGQASQITQITNTGALLTGVDETAESLTVTATSVVDDTKTATLSVPLTGDVVHLGFRRRIEEEAGGAEGFAARVASFNAPADDPDADKAAADKAAADKAAADKAAADKAETTKK